MWQGAGLPVVWVIIFKPAHVDETANAGGISGAVVIVIKAGHADWFANANGFFALSCKQIGKTSQLTGLALSLIHI